MPKILADDVQWLRTRLTANGVPEAKIEAHLSVIGNPQAMEAALAWYRVRGTHHEPVGLIKVPTLYIWGDTDDTVGRMAAEGTGEFIAAPYQFAPLEGVGHFAADQAPERVTALLLQHLARHPYYMLDAGFGAWAGAVDEAREAEGRGVDECGFSQGS